MNVYILEDTDSDMLTCMDAHSHTHTHTHFFLIPSLLPKCSVYSWLKWTEVFIVKQGTGVVGIRESINNQQLGMLWNMDSTFFKQIIISKSDAEASRYIIKTTPSRWNSCSHGNNCRMSDYSHFLGGNCFYYNGVGIRDYFTSDPRFNGETKKTD